MDVDARNFDAELPGILAAIDQSRFVAFDLELSGIPRKQRGPVKTGIKVSGKQELQWRYSETKAAAEKYQILQFGLTCAIENVAEGSYTLQSYNIFLSPLVDNRLKYDRDFTCQGGAIDFLLGHGFPMDRPFQGVRYLSFDEEAHVRDTIEASWKNRENLEDIAIDDANVELMHRTRGEIRSWLANENRERVLNIAPIDHEKPDYIGRGLNGYQKRLVHQLVRAEFSDLVSVSKPEFIQIIPYDQEREEAQVKKKRKNLDSNLDAQVGLRRIIEAFTRHPGILIGRQKPSDVGNESKAEAIDAKTKLVVGHNVFIDLIYLIQNLICQIPDDVDDFLRLVALVFPSVVDTKYIADNLNDNSALYRSSLEELADEYTSSEKPFIDVPPDYAKYLIAESPHEAGYDSFLTAVVLIRIARKLTASSAEATPIPSIAGSSSDDSSPKSAVSAVATAISDGISLISTKVGLSEVSADQFYGIPSPADPFWETYANKLRVNGTIDGFCTLPNLFTSG